ncbi:MAG TPA: HepT-like ribonuclease domain-containing protein [Actinomycetota bacterium]|nr:HepT-like ribonuclease domain-containing protein [Actinomycetota bacterium]
MNRDQQRLEDILEYTGLIRRHTAGGRAVLDDEVTQAAVTRWIEIIGEAAGAVSAELRVDYPEVPWRDLVGMRNILVHAYRRVNLNLAWRAVERLPEIERQIVAILAEEEWPE